jgi:hypothetical protein
MLAVAQSKEQGLHTRISDYQFPIANYCGGAHPLGQSQIGNRKSTIFLCASVFLW